ncbi:porin family protein [Rubrivirga sp.]|uniref:porin family protein n=1 Tax=Rubrivirga sp. TaxID=1885344 RepID=UPI003B519FC9
MRLVFFSVALVALVAAPASAQTTFLLKGGLNTAFFSGDDALIFDPRLGASGGAGLRFDVSPSLGVQVEALYSQEGAKQDNGSGTYELDYIDVPVLLRAGLPLTRYADAGLYAGPQIGIPVRAEFAPDRGPNEDEQTRTDIGIALGADYWSGPVGVDLRYVIGLQDAFDDEIDGVPVDPLFVRNQAFTVSLGYRFGGKATGGRGGRGRY